MADLNSLVIFAKVVEAKGFSEAASRLKIPLSTVSRRVAELEDPAQVGTSPHTAAALSRQPPAAGPRVCRLTAGGSRIRTLGPSQSQHSRRTYRLAAASCRTPPSAG